MTVNTNSLHPSGLLAMVKHASKAMACSLVAIFSSSACASSAHETQKFECWINKASSTFYIFARHQSPEQIGVSVGSFIGTSEQYSRRVISQHEHAESRCAEWSLPQIPCKPVLTFERPEPVYFAKHLEDIETGSAYCRELKYDRVKSILSSDGFYYRQAELSDTRYDAVFGKNWIRTPNGMGSPSYESSQNLYTGDIILHAFADTNTHLLHGQFDASSEDIRIANSKVNKHLKFDTFPKGANHD